MIKFVDWLFSDPEGFKTHSIFIPDKLNHALEAFAFMKEVEVEEVILQSLNEYLRNNLWAVKETERRTVISRPKQLRG